MLILWFPIIIEPLGTGRLFNGEYFFTNFFFVWKLRDFLIFFGGTKMFSEERKLEDRVLYLIDNCLTPYETIEHAGILCEGEYILAIGGASAFTKDEGLKVQELKNCYAVPAYFTKQLFILNLDLIKFM